MTSMESARLILLGAPGSGKGTQAAILAEAMDIPSISTGQVLRDAVSAGTDLGKKVETILVSGQLVDDTTMEEVVRHRLKVEDCQKGFILDGFPRTVGQVEILDSILGAQDQQVDTVVHIAVPETELVRRALTRQRADDQQDVILQRLEVYREQTQPLIDHYRGRGLLRTVDGDQPIHEVADSVMSALEVNC